MNTEIFSPLMAMVALTVMVYIRLIIVRNKAVKTREVPIKYFRVYQGDALPDHIAAIDRHLVNLYELPILFYLAVIVAYISGKVDGVVLALAWGFVASRYVHSYIHLTYNNIQHRLAAFAVGALLVLVFWVLLAIRLL